MNYGECLLRASCWGCKDKIEGKGLPAIYGAGKTGKMMKGGFRVSVCECVSVCVCVCLCVSVCVGMLVSGSLC